MIIHHEIATREKFEIPRGTHRSNSLIILLDGEFDYTVQNETRRIVPLSPMVFKNGVAFKKVVIHPIKYIIIRFSHLPENSDIFQTYHESDRGRLADSISRLHHAIANKASSILSVTFCSSPRSHKSPKKMASQRLPSTSASITAKNFLLIFLQKKQAIPSKP